MAPNRSLSAKEAAELLPVSNSAIYELIRRGESSACKVGRKARFTQDDVDAYIAAVSAALKVCLPFLSPYRK